MNKKIAVINTSPLISLGHLKLIPILGKLFSTVYIPQAVYNEFLDGFEHKQEGKNLLDYEWMQTAKVKNEYHLNSLFELDRGEAEVIVLAGEISADHAILDEKLGRYYAQRHQLKVTGTLGILLNAKKKGYISSINEKINLLKQKNRWFSDNLVQTVLKIANEL